MELIFIGTSSGRTNLSRYHSALLFKDTNSNILIDSGDGISRALMSSQCSINSISDIIISHFHSDHLAGLPSLLTQMVIEKKSTPLSIYVHIELRDRLEEFLNTSFLFTETFHFQTQIKVYDFENEFRVNDSIKLWAKQNSHITNKHNLEIKDLSFISSSFRFKVNNKDIIYTSDISKTNDLYLFNQSNIELFITEATHVDLNELLKAYIIINPKYMYLTHIDDEKKTRKWYNQLDSKTRMHIVLAEDQMRIQL